MIWSSTDHGAEPLLAICVPSSLQTGAALCSRLTCERSLSASGCVEVGQGSRAREQNTECCRDEWGLLLLQELMYSCRSKNRCLSEQLWVRSHLLAEFLARAQLLVVGFLAALCAVGQC